MIVTNTLTLTQKQEDNILQKVGKKVERKFGAEGITHFCIKGTRLGIHGLYQVVLELCCDGEFYNIRVDVCKANKPYMKSFYVEKIEEL